MILDALDTSSQQLNCASLTANELYKLSNNYKKYRNKKDFTSRINKLIGGNVTPSTLDSIHEVSRCHNLVNKIVLSGGDSQKKLNNALTKQVLVAQNSLRNILAGGNINDLQNSIMGLIDKLQLNQINKLLYNLLSKINTLETRKLKGKKIVNGGKKKKMSPSSIKSELELNSLVLLANLLIKQKEKLEKNNS